MKMLNLLLLSFMSGLIFYCCSPDNAGQNNSKERTILEGESDSVKFIHREIVGQDTTWKLNLLSVDVEDTPELVSKKKPHIIVCMDPAIKNKKETILFFQKGVTQKDEYKINEDSSWCADIKIKYKEDLIGSKKVENYTFTGIVNYKDTVSSNAKYIHGNSVCKIRITY